MSNYLSICLSIFLFIPQSIWIVIPLPYLSSNDAHSFILLALPQLLSSYDGEIVDGGGRCGLLKCIEQLLGMICICIVCTIISCILFTRFYLCIYFVNGHNWYYNIINNYNITHVFIYVIFIYFVVIDKSWIPQR